MTTRPMNPIGVPPPAGAYSHAIVATGPGDTVYISGQLGINERGVLADGFAGQAEQCWRNVTSILSAVGFTAHNLVKVTTFVTDISFAPVLAAVREPFLQGARPASTLVEVAALARPEWMIEIEAVAFGSASHSQQT